MASGPEGPRRLTLTDRYNERLILHWKPLTFVPNLALILDRHRQQDGRGVKFTELRDAPAPWHAVLRRLEKSGSMVNTARFFEETQLLVELTLLWPSRRDVNLEKEILASVAPGDPEAPTWLWQAMGLSVTIGRQFDLVRCDPKVGRVRWDFATDRKADPDVTVERLAMYQNWLKSPLRDWLVSQLPEGHRAVRQDVVGLGPHRAERLLSAGRGGRLGPLLGLRRDRLDLAWLCPTEGRLYRLAAARTSRTREVVLPDSLAVHCCRAPVPMPAGER